MPPPSHSQPSLPQAIPYTCASYCAEQEAGNQPSHDNDEHPLAAMSLPSLPPVNSSFTKLSYRAEHEAGNQPSHDNDEHPLLNVGCCPCKASIPAVPSTLHAPSQSGKVEQKCLSKKSLGEGVGGLGIPAADAIRRCPCKASMPAVASTLHAPSQSGKYKRGCLSNEKLGEQIGLLGIPPCKDHRAPPMLSKDHQGPSDTAHAFQGPSDTAHAFQCIPVHPYVLQEPLVREWDGPHLTRPDRIFKKFEHRRQCEETGRLGIAAVAAAAAAAALLQKGVSAAPASRCPCCKA